MSAAKPVLRGFHASQAKKELVISFVIAAVAGYSFKVLYADRIKQKYADFYRTCDPMEDFKDMARKGRIRSVPPEMVDLVDTSGGLTPPKGKF